MARIQVPEGTGLEASRIWQLAPHLGVGIQAVTDAVYVHSTLGVREREVMRMRIAQLNRCEVCMNTRARTAMDQGLSDELYASVGSYFDNPHFTERERLAAEFGERFAIDHTAIDDELWQRLRAHFSESEILELTVTAGVCVGIGRAFHVLDVERDFEVLWSKEAAHPQGGVTL